LLLRCPVSRIFLFYRPERCVRDFSDCFHICKMYLVSNIRFSHHSCLTVNDSITLERVSMVRC
jgi:hypothetical protein